MRLPHARTEMDLSTRFRGEVGIWHDRALEICILTTLAAVKERGAEDSHIANHRYPVRIRVLGSESTQVTQQHVDQPVMAMQSPAAQSL